MALREQAKKAAATRPEETEPAGGAPGPVVAAAEQQALEASVRRAKDRHGVPDSHAYNPQTGAMHDGTPAAEAPALGNGRASGGTPEPARPRLVMGTPLQLTEQQYQALLTGINPNRIGNKQGQSHLEAWDVRRYLTKIFGFGGWSVKTLGLTKIHDRAVPPGEGMVNRWVGPQGNRTRSKVPNDDWMFTVVYEAQVALTIFNPDGTVGAYFEDGATGDGINMPTYQQAADFALKTALSQALKRCAVNLGDQFGLSLYNHGSVNAQVGLTLRPPTWEGLPPADEELIRQATSNEQVHGEEDPQGETPDYPDGRIVGSNPEDPGEGAPNGLPSAQDLANEALERATALDQTGVLDRLRAILAMVRRDKGDHPELGTASVIDGSGDPVELDRLIYNLIQERKKAATAAGAPEGTS